MHLSFNLSFLTLLAASVAAAPLAGAPASPTLAVRVVAPTQPPAPTALPTIGVIKSPTAGGGYYRGGAYFDFVFLKPTSPGFTVKYINLATNLTSLTSQISAKLPIPDDVFTLYVKGKEPGFVQVTEFDAPRPGYDGGAIYPPATEINLFNYPPMAEPVAGPKPLPGPKPVAGPKPIAGPKPVAGPPVVPGAGKPV
ncbi:hypothetical protein RQP46_007801 [Phenoliferia psychrophenolica]